MTPAEYIAAARCPETMSIGNFGLWTIDKRYCTNEREEAQVGWPNYTLLGRMTEATIHLPLGEIVMEDSRRELRRHLPIMLNARGRVLVTGLGLGCVVRGLLANPAVEHVTVLEIDSDIIRAVWGEFQRNERLLLLQGDAFEYAWPPGMRFDFAWHDIYREGVHEAVLHGKLMVRYAGMVRAQGAWGMPRWFRRRIGGDFLVK